MDGLNLEKMSFSRYINLLENTNNIINIEFLSLIEKNVRTNKNNGSGRW